MDYRCLLSGLMRCFCRRPCVCAISRATFRPKRPSYRFQYFEEERRIRCVPYTADIHPYFDEYKDRYLCKYATNFRGNKIAYVLINLHTNPKCTIIFSHGNFCDIGGILPTYIKLSEDLESNIMLYDYSGYGWSSGTPSEEVMYEDIEAVYKALTQKHGIPADEIVLYGHSIGTVPTVDLASKHEVKGVILQSALESGMKVVCPRHRGTFDVNFYTTIDKVPKVTSPVLVIHGTEDEVIDFSHGVAIYERCPRPVDPLWVEGAGHNDVELYGQYLERLKRFVTVELVN